jgi:ATP-dependent RNA helicase DeaD
MDAADIERALGRELWAALARKGYSQLTSVQEAVLDPALDGRDLRITSQTGSGKTLAIGFALRPWVLLPPAVAHGVSLPRALVVAPTRELARQTQAELGWLYADCNARVVAITGGASFRDERRELAKGAPVVVGTPGRLLDHLGRGSIDPSEIAAIVLDEADRLLDMGFREDLDAILGHAPPEHRTHLVSATFPRAVRALADRVQRDAAHVEGTRLGAANADIDNVIHVIDTRQKVDAIINLLLASPQEQTLVFARTRADVASLAQQLANAGFAATAISGELDQAARTRALSAFKHGRESVLVATDVAARGIDVQDVTRVIQAEPPTSADAYTHRAGRTGRAGRKGTSHLLISAAQVVPVTRLLRAAAIAHRFEPIPSAELIRRAIDERIFEELAHEAPDEGAESADLRAHALARRLLASGETERILARLLRARYAGAAEPRDVRPAPRQAPPPMRRGGGAREIARRSAGDDSYVPFRVSWGGRQGADARRLLAIACRRGEIRGSDVGAIRIEADHSIVEVASSVASAFATHAARPDPRDRRVLIRLAASPGDRAPYALADKRARAPRPLPPKDGHAPLRRRS